MNLSLEIGFKRIYYTLKFLVLGTVYMTLVALFYLEDIIRHPYLYWKNK